MSVLPVTLLVVAKAPEPGRAKIGLNEVAIGLAMPAFGIELAAARLTPTALTRAVVQAELFDPEGAALAGYVDRVEDGCVAVAIEEARRLGALSTKAYGKTKVAIRQPLVDRVLAGLDANLRGFGVEQD